MADLKLEISVLGSMINDEACKAIGVQKISKKEVFEHDISRILYTVIYELFILQEEVDAYNIREKLVKSKKYNIIGDELYKEIIAYKLSIPNLESRIKKIKDDYLYRVQVEVATNILNKSREKNLPPDELVLEAIKALEASLSLENTDTARPVGQLLKEVMFNMESKNEKDKGYSTGYKELDEFFTILPETLITISARSSVGKTAFLLQILRRLSFFQNVKTAAFSLEMKDLSYAKRLATAHLHINSYAFTNNCLSDNDKNRFFDFVNSFASVPMFIDDNPYYNTNSIIARIIVLALTKGIKVFAIDYLTLVKLVFEYKGQTKSDAISDFTAALKALTRKLGITIIILQQLNRELDKRPNPRPVLADIKDSSSIESDSDVVIFLYRPDMYTQNLFEAVTKQEKEDYGHLSGKYILFHHNGREVLTPEVKNKCEVIIAKNREGATGSLYFDAHNAYGGFEYNEYLSSLINKKKNESNNIAEIF